MSQRPAKQIGVRLGVPPDRKRAALDDGTLERLLLRRELLGAPTRSRRRHCRGVRGVRRHLDGGRERRSLFRAFHRALPPARDALEEVVAFERDERGVGERLAPLLDSRLAHLDDTFPGGSRHPHGDAALAVLVLHGVHVRLDVVRELEAGPGRRLRAASALLHGLAHLASLHGASLRRRLLELVETSFAHLPRAIHHVREDERHSLDLRERAREFRRLDGARAPAVDAHSEAVDGIFQRLEFVIAPRLVPRLLLRLGEFLLLGVGGRALRASRLAIGIFVVLLRVIVVVAAATALAHESVGALLVRIVHPLAFARTLHSEAFVEAVMRVRVRGSFHRLLGCLGQRVGPEILGVRGCVVRARAEHRGGEGIPGSAADGAVFRPASENLIDVLVGKRRSFLARLVAERAVDAKLEQLVDLLSVILERAAAAGRRVSAAEHSLVETVLLRRRLEEALLVRRFGHQAVHLHLLRLTDAVAPRHRLEIVLRVPVRVVDDGGVRGGEGDPHAARAGGEEVDESAIRGVEPIDASLAIRLRGGPVESLKLKVHHVEIILEDVEDDGELGKDEHLLALGFELGKKLGHEHHLAGGGGEEFEVGGHRRGRGRRGRRKARLLRRRHRVGRRLFRRRLDRALALVGVILLDPVAQEGMVAHLAKLHAQVAKLRDVLPLVPLQQHVHLLLVDGAVVVALFGSELHPHHNLFLGGDGLHVLFHAAQHPRLEHLAKPHHLLRVNLPPAAAKLILEILPARVLLRVQHVHHPEELANVVLDGRAGEEEEPVVPNLHHRLGGLRVDILEFMRLVDDAERPLKLRDEIGEPSRRLEGDEEDVELGRSLRSAGLEVKLSLLAHASILGVSVEDDDVHLRPLLHLAFPVAEGGEGRDDEKRAGRAKLARAHVLHDRDALRRLAQSHFVAEDDVVSPAIIPHHPLERRHLVLAEHHAVLERGRLGLHRGLRAGLGALHRRVVHRLLRLEIVATLEQTNRLEVLGRVQILGGFPRRLRVPQTLPLHQILRPRRSLLRGSLLFLGRSILLVLDLVLVLFGEGFAFVDDAVDDEVIGVEGLGARVRILPQSSFEPLQLPGRLVRGVDARLRLPAPAPVRASLPLDAVQPHLLTLGDGGVAPRRRAGGDRVLRAVCLELLLVHLRRLERVDNLFDLLQGFGLGLVPRAGALLVRFEQVGEFLVRVQIAERFLGGGGAGRSGFAGNDERGGRGREFGGAEGGGFHLDDAKVFFGHAVALEVARDGHFGAE